MVGRDVLGAPRPRDAHGTPTGTPHVRGPPGTSAPTMPHVLSAPHVRSTPMVGRDVLGAPRPRDAHGTPTGTPRVRGPPGTSAPTMPHPCPHPTSCRHHMVGRDVLGAPRTQDAHGTHTGTPRVRGPPGTSAPTMPHPCPRPVHTHGRARRPRRAAPTERPRDAHGDATCTRAAGDVGPYHASPMSTPYALSTPMVGRDVLGAPRPRDAHRDAHGTPTGRPRERHVYTGRRGRRPLPCLTSCPHPTPYPHPLAGDDVRRRP